MSSIFHPFRAFDNIRRWYRTAVEDASYWLRGDWRDYVASKILGTTCYVVIGVMLVNMVLAVLAFN